MESEGGRLDYPLLENALDFLLSAAEHAGQGSPRSWKYAILHLIAGTELLLKARLELEHWSLVFQDVDKADKRTHTSGDFRSADFESLCNRLERISGVCIGNDDRKHLHDLRNLRNRLEHFGIKIDLPQVKSLVAKGLSFAVAFCESHLKERMGNSEERVLASIVVQLREFQEFVSERLKAVATKITPGALLRECPMCFQETLEALEAGTLECHFCGHQVAAGTLAEQRSELGVEVCPQCGCEALAFIVYNNDSAGWECFACGAEFDNLRHCSSCGELYSGDLPICRDCFEHMVNKDNG